MANEVKTTLSIDDQAGLAKIANFKKELSSFNATKQLGASSASGNDALMRRAQADIARYQKQTADGEKNLTRQIEREAESRYRIQVNTQKRAVNDMLRELKRIEAEEKRLSQPTASGRGFLGAGSFSLTQIAQGTLIGASAAYGLNLTQTAIDRAVEQSRANRLIASSATEAGIAQGVLAEKNKAFAQSVGISNRAAAETTAMITRLATFSGNSSPERITQLLKAFADLGAARGIGGGELRDLIGTILSGQDEGLNRLGIADPGILQKAYAKQLGITTDALTQQQKVQAAVSAVLEKAGLFAGSAETRMKSLEGQVTSGAAAWENFKDALSATFSTSGPVTDFLTEASQALKGLALDLDDVNKQLAKGRTPRDIAQQNYPGPSAGDIIQSASTGIFYALGGTVAYDVLSGTSPNNPQSLTQQVPSALYPYTRHFNDYVQRIQNQKTSNDKQAQDAVANQKPLYQKATDELNALEIETTKKYLTQRSAFLATARENELNALKGNYSVQEALLNQHLTFEKASENKSIQEITALKNRSLQDQIKTNQAYYGELIQIANQRAKAATTPEDQTKYQEEAAKYQLELSQAVTQAQNEIKTNVINGQTEMIKKIRELRDEYRSTFVGIASETNPFIRVMEDSAQAVKRVNDQFKDLGPLAQYALTQAITAAGRLKAYDLDLGGRKQAFDYRLQAREFRQGFRFDFSDQSPEGVANLNNLVRDEIRSINYFDNSPKLFGSREYNEAAARLQTYNSREGQHLRDQQIIDATRNLDPRYTAPDVRAEAAAAREREADYATKQEQRANQFYDNFEAGMLTGFPVKVQSGQDFVIIKNESGGNARVETNRGTPADTNYRYPQ